MTPPRLLLITSLVGTVIGFAWSNVLGARDAVAMERFVADREACAQAGMRPGTSALADCVVGAAKVRGLAAGAADS